MPRSPERIADNQNEYNPDYVNEKLLAKITNLDKGIVITSQFEPKVKMSIDKAQYSETAGFGSTNSTFQYTHDKQGSMRITLMLYARHQNEYATDKLNTLKEWAKKDPDIGRPPLLQVKIGEDILYAQCIIFDFGEIEYGNMRPDGTYRSVTFDIEFKEYKQMVMDIQESTSESLSYKAAYGDTFETVCKKFYSDASFSLSLRKSNMFDFGLNQVNAGDIIKVPKFDILFNNYSKDFLLLKTLKRLLD